MFLANLAGPDFLILIVIVGVLLFGGAAIPKLARSLGSAKTEFEKGLSDSKAKAATEEAPSSEAPKTEA